MSYYSHVAVAFKKNDWTDKVLPEVAKLDEDNKYLLKQGELCIDKDSDAVIVRWNEVNYWDNTQLCKTLKRLARQLPSDYCEVGEDIVNKIGCKMKLDVIERYVPYFRFPNEVGVYALDNMARNLLQMLLEKGVPMEDIEKRAIMCKDGYPYCGVKEQLRKYAAEIEADAAKA